MNKAINIILIGCVLFLLSVFVNTSTVKAACSACGGLTGWINDTCFSAGCGGAAPRHQIQCNVDYSCDSTGVSKYWQGRCVADPSCAVPPPPGPAPAPPPPAPGCIGNLPTPAILASPANGAILTSNSVTLSWSAGASWGIGCPSNNNTFWVYTKPNCTGPWVLQATLPGGVTSKLVSGLAWGINYCWLVQKDNGQSFINSAQGNFTTAQPPTIVSSGFTAASTAKCSGASISGSADFSNTNNPITYTSRISHASNNFAGSVNNFQEARIIVIPSSVQNGAIVANTALETPTNIANYAIFAVKNLNTTPVFSTISNGINATLLPSTVTQVSNTDLQIDWNIKFNNTYTTSNANVPVNVYLMAVSKIGAVTLSQSPAGAQLLQYNRVNNTWKVDTLAPTATVGSIVNTGPTTFDIAWTANDTTSGNQGISDVRTYCFTNSSPEIITRTGPLPNQVLNLPGSPVNYPTAANCGISTNTSINVTNNYSVAAPTVFDSDLTFKLFAQDGACNQSQASSNLVNTSPWIVTSGGSATANGGFQAIKPRNINDLSSVVSGLSDSSYLTTASAISGTASLPASRASKLDYKIFNYQDLGAKPPAISGTNSWYEFISSLVSSRVAAGTTLYTSVSSASSANLVGATGIVPSVNSLTNPTVVKVTPPIGSGSTLTIAAGSVCNANLVILINGNLVLNPNLNNLGSSRCIFVVSGNITVDAGVRSTTTNTVSNPSIYDQLDGMFITDGSFTTSLDTVANTGDGLKINGGVTASTATLGRRFASAQSGTQPTEVFIFDPNYQQIFRDLLSIKELSLREQ